MLGLIKTRCSMYYISERALIKLAHCLCVGFRSRQEYAQMRFLCKWSVILSTLNFYCDVICRSALNAKRNNAPGWPRTTNLSVNSRTRLPIAPRRRLLTRLFWFVMFTRTLPRTLSCKVGHRFSQMLLAYCRCCRL